MTLCDLRSERLIPVLVPDESRSGATHIEPMGLRRLLADAHRCRDLAIATAPAAAGMLRVLYVLAARITGLDRVRSQSEFETARYDIAEQGTFDPDAIEAYLCRPDLDSRWNLFDPVWPWLQDRRLATQADPKSVNAFDPTRPRDNGRVWWRHTWTERVPELATAEALQWLLTHHWYGSGGSGGTRTVGATSNQYLSAGPLRGTVSFYPLGSNLFQTIIAGIPSPATGPGLGDDLAPWEIESYHDPLGNPPEAASWPAGVLLGQSRHAMLLVPDQTGSHVRQCCLTWGYKRRHPPLADPYTIQDRREDTWVPRRANASRAAWRDVDALLADHDDHCRPQVWTATQTLPESWQQQLRVRVHGWDQDLKSIDRSMFSATTPELVRWSQENDPDAADGAAALHLAAEELHGQMRKALRTAYANLAGSSQRKTSRETPWNAAADASYWPAAEQLFWEAMRQRRFDQTYRLYLPLALTSVDAATRHVGHHPPVAREIADVVRSLRRFTALKNPRPKDAADAV